MNIYLTKRTIWRNAHHMMQPELSLKIGPLDLRIHGRRHPDEADPYDFDWLAVSSSFQGSFQTSPADRQNIEAEELASFQQQLEDLIDGAAQLKFYPLEQLFQLEINRVDGDSFQADLLHESGGTVAFQVSSVELRRWTDALSVILNRFPPRTKLTG